tara:strand:- start:1931 stop:3241 length:1311 start_codon:yes stop_codon:yes gene_type:complete
MLRAAAANKGLDMSDAFESYAGRGRDANLGIMQKGRFNAAMTDMFKRLAADQQSLRTICRAYGTGDPDPREPGGYMQVQYKQFALDFDDVRLPSFRGPDVDALGPLLPALQQLRLFATKQKLDLTDAFEEAAGKGRDAQLGIMAKNRFRAAMGAMFKGECGFEVLNGICRAYGTGDKDPRDPSGASMKVLFKEFALDFDNMQPPAVNEPSPEAELMASLRQMRLFAQDKRLDLTDFFESYAGKGREAQLGLMPKNRFQAAVCDIFKGMTVPMRVLDLIATTYGAGDADPREPGEYLKVQWKKFAVDFDRIDVPPEKARQPFSQDMVDALSDLKGEAVRRKLDMTNCFESYAGGGVDYNLGVMQKGRFCSALAVLFPSISLSDALLRRICAAYPAGDPDQSPAGGTMKVQWRQFAIDFDESIPEPWHAGKAPPPRSL